MVGEQVELGSVTVDIDSLRGILRSMQQYGLIDEYGLSEMGSNVSVTLRPNGLGDVTILVQEVRFDG